MSHNNPYRDADGLQAVENEAFPEVVPGQKLGRQSTLESPELVPGQEAYRDNKNVHSPYASAVPMNEGYFTDHSSSPPQYQDYPGKGSEGLDGSSRAQRRICGIPRKRFIWAAILLVAVIILAAVLGGVLGSVLGNSDDDGKTSNGASTQPQTGNSTTSAAEKKYTAIDKTGVALLSPADSNSIFSYYMSSDGLVEAEFTNGLSSTSNDSQIKSTIIATNARSTSPIAAVEVTPPGASLYRIVFYIDKNNHPTFVNMTGNGNWSNPQIVFSGLIASDSTNALAAVAGTSSYLNGIRIYFGASSSSDNSGYIQEVGTDFADSSVQKGGYYNVWKAFNGSDPNAGVASVVTASNKNHLYFRDRSSGVLQQWVWDYAFVSAGDGGDQQVWVQGANSTSSVVVVEKGSIAAAHDGARTDYIFYQNENENSQGGKGGVSVAMYSGSGNETGSALSEDAATISTAIVGYSLAAAWDRTAGDAVVMNQNGANTTSLVFSGVTGTGNLNATTFDTQEK